MQIIKLFLMVSLISFLSSGCSDGKSHKSNKSNMSTINLVLGVRTQVKSGDTYYALSDNALVTFEHNTTTNKRYITLTQGEGQLIASTNQN